MRSLLYAHLKCLNSSATNRESAKKAAKKLACLRKIDKEDRAHFTFYPYIGKLEEEIADLRTQDYIVFQVVAKNAFTNFSRLQKRRFYKPELEEIAKKRSNAGSAGQAC
jgi:hypothetical protein